MDVNSLENKIRKFNVTVLSIPIVYDIFGDYDPNGLMYILSEDRDRVREKALCNFRNKDENGDPLSNTYRRSSTSYNKSKCWRHNNNRV